MFEGCPEPTAVVDGASIIGHNAAFRSRFGEASSLLACLEPADHAAATSALDPHTNHTTFIARLALGPAAGKPMRWTAWTAGDALTCVRLDGPAAPSDPKLTPIVPLCDNNAPAPDTAWILHEIYKHIDAIVFVMDKEGTILLSEGNGLAHFGLKPGQVVGRNAFQIYAPNSSGQINTRKALNGESVRASAMEGTSYFVTWNEPIRDEAGDVNGLVGLAICIDANAKSMLEAKSLLGAIEQLPVSIWAMERDGTCFLSTGNGLRDLGIEPGELVGKNLFEIYAAQPAFAKDMARVLAGEHLTSEARIGDTYWRNHFVPARNILGDEVVRVYAVAENVTERTQNDRRLEEQLALIQAQQKAIAGLSCPIIEVWQGVIVVPVIGNLDEHRAGILLEQLLNEVVTRQAGSVILDLTGVEGVEAATATHLFNILRSVELLGARGLISGIRPNVAKTMVELDIPLSARTTYPTLAEALRRLIGVRRGAAARS